MCGIVGIVGKGPVNQSLYDALLVAARAFDMMFVRWRVSAPAARSVANRAL